ncbi:MAG: EAL domain-containing protein [Candidatus Thiodiazotropha sp. (ex Myrtea sp. 'scaly one' KF741663)]|nr:EAL domain-containing protein [Candidatus Thiodiazotropha sp. (ex Myrtea sp. 'scaly one' KF741663)]
MSDEAIELLVIGNSTPEIEAYLDHLRNSGFAAHATQIEHDADLLGKTLKAHRDLDILIYTVESDELGSGQLFAVLSAINPTLPVIAVTETIDEVQRIELMRNGAADLILLNEYSHITQAILREYKHLRAVRRLQHVERQFLEAEERCNALTENSRDAIAYVHEGMHVTANRAYLELFGLAGEDEIDGLPIMDMIAPSEHKSFKKLLRQLSADAGHNAELKTKCLRGDGKEFNAELHFTPASIEGEPCTQVVIHDQSVSREVEEKLRLLSTQDVQTGLYNRQYFLSLLDDETRDQCNRGRNRQTLFYVTLDNFSEIRNKTGIKASDTLLLEIARLLKGALGSEDMLARFGDHTFTFLAPGSDTGTASKRAKKICKAVAKHTYSNGDKSLKPTCSIGIAFTSNDISSGHEFVTLAYNACETARNEGPNLFSLATEKTKNESTESASEADLSHLIRFALDNDQFQLVFQPIVSLHGDTRENYAVTLRLMDEKQEEIQPDHFMNQAALMGKTQEIDRWVIRRAIAELSNQRKQGQKINFFINISGASLEDDSLLLYICDCLRDYEAKGPWVTFQCRDSDARSHMQHLEKLSDGLKKIKCKLCIDHFGLAKKPEAILSGNLPLDYIQFAPSFLDGLSENQDKQDTLNQLNELIQGQNIKTIASGVEEASNLAILWTIGVNYIRGYFIQEPTQTINYDFPGE